MELVEVRQDQQPGGIVRYPGGPQQAGRRGQRVSLGVGLELGRDPASAEGDAEVPLSRQCPYGLAYRAVGGAPVCVLESHRDVAEGQYAAEVDDDRRHLELQFGFDAQPANERGLAVASGGAETHEVCACGEIEQASQLVLAVDQVVDGPLEDEWVTGCHVRSVANTTFYTYR